MEVSSQSRDKSYVRLLLRCHSIRSSDREMPIFVLFLFNNTRGSQTPYPCPYARQWHSTINKKIALTNNFTRMVSTVHWTSSGFDTATLESEKSILILIFVDIHSNQIDDDYLLSKRWNRNAIDKILQVVHKAKT